MGNFHNKTIVVSTTAFLVLAAFFPGKSYASWTWNGDSASLDAQNCAAISKTIKLTASDGGGCLASEFTYNDGDLKVYEPLISIYRSAKEAQKSLHAYDSTYNNPPVGAQIGDDGEWVFFDSATNNTERHVYWYQYSRSLNFALGRCVIVTGGRSDYEGSDQGPAPLENKITELAKKLIPELREVCEAKDDAPPAPDPASKECDDEEYHQKYKACIGTCNEIDTSSVTGYDKFEACMQSCGDIRSECKTPADNIPEVGSPADNSEGSDGELSGGVQAFGTKNGAAFTLADAELKDAASRLKKIKQQDDSRWTDKKNFAVTNGEALRQASVGASPEQVDQITRIGQIVRTGSEKTRDVATAIKDGLDYNEYVDTQKFGPYDGMGFFTDTAGGIIDYADMRAKGMSVKNAASKALLDNYGVSVLTSIPILKAIDIVATTPDKMLDVIGLSKDGVLRQATGVVNKFAPSGVVKQTTELMAENNWSDIGRTLAYGWDKLKNAHGVGDTLLQTGTLLDASIGAVPVAIARGFSDTLGVTIFAGQSALDFANRLFR